MRARKQYIHVNKQKDCWTIHNSLGCYHVDEIDIEVPCSTVHKVKKKDNPRFFIVCRGVLTIDGNVGFIRESADD